MPKIVFSSGLRRFGARELGIEALDTAALSTRANKFCVHSNKFCACKQANNEPGRMSTSRPVARLRPNNCYLVILAREFLNRVR
jgi:hypothetical protein